MGYRHYSVFGHTVVYFEADEKVCERLASVLFKSIWYPPKYKNKIGISLRHYLEYIDAFYPDLG